MSGQNPAALTFFLTVSPAGTGPAEVTC